jgi:dihydrofolate reductase
MITKNKLKNPIFCIVAMNENRIIGDGKKLLWHLPDDLKRLKKITMGSPLIMGRKTWDSIGRPLPGRANIVLTNSISWRADGAIVVNSFEDAIFKADQWIDLNSKINQNIVQKKIFLFGGAEIYKIGLEYCDNIQMTKVNFDLKTGIKFPKLNERDWEKTKLEHKLATNNVPEHSFWHYKRIV